MLICTASLIKMFHHEGTKDTKGSENHVPNFALFVSFVVKN